VSESCVVSLRTVVWFIMDLLRLVLLTLFGIASKCIAGDVTVLTSDNFDSIALNPKKDVLVEFFAPWCGHCKRLAPVYEKVAGTFKNDANCVVASVDADDAQNRPLSEKYSISGFPTIKFFPKDNKDGEEYNGGRDEQDFIDFLNEKCKLNRRAGGLLNEMEGRISKFDDLAKTFMKEVGNREKILKEATAIAETEEQSKTAAYYIKVMQKVLDKGDSYPSTELSRLDRMLSGQMSSTQVDGIYKRKNVLAQFQLPEKEEL